MKSKNELTGKPVLMKTLNIGLITDALADNRMATRVELSRITGISQPTVNALIEQLVKNQVVVSVGIGKSTGGRKAEIFMLNQQRVCIATVIAEQTQWTTAVFDLNLKQLSSAKIKHKESLSYFDDLCCIIQSIIEDNKQVGAVAVGVPGAVSEEGRVFAVPQITEWEQFVLKDSLEEKIGIPVIVLNDINAVTLGCLTDMTSMAGTAPPVQNMIYVHVGNGFGAGIIIGGKLYTGNRSFAGEIGYMQVGDDFQPGNETNSRLADRVLLKLEKLIVNLICVLNPDKIMLGGSDIPTDQLSDLEKACLKMLPSDVIPEIKIVDSEQSCYFNGLAKSCKRLIENRIRLTEEWRITV